MNPDGSDQHRVTINEYDDDSPALSPDGSQIAFISNRNDPNPDTCKDSCFYQLYIVNSDGSSEHQLIETELSTMHPDRHPDGRRISFDTEFELEGVFKIYTINVIEALEGKNGFNPIKLTDNQVGDLWPSWGQEIVP